MNRRTKQFDAAIATGCVDKVLPIREIGSELMRLAITGHDHASARV